MRILLHLLLRVVTAFVLAFGLGYILFKTIQSSRGLRVTRDAEFRGLDIGEHGMEADRGFQIFATQ